MKSIFHPNYEEFRQKLVAARKMAGLTQIELAKKLSKPQSFVSKFERGEILSVFCETPTRNGKTFCNTITHSPSSVKVV